MYWNRRIWRAVEAVCHALLGFLIGFLVVGLLDSLDIIVVNWVQNFWISTVITFLNMVKAYLLRDYFHMKRKLHKIKFKRRKHNE